MDKLQKLREALEQQRKYEAENWPFADEENKATGTGESLSYHLASLYCWSPEYVLTLPPEQRDERLREVWRSFSLAGDIIHRYEDATLALLVDGDSRVSNLEKEVKELRRHGNIQDERFQQMVAALERRYDELLRQFALMERRVDTVEKQGASDE